jgi:Tfp pilus assembly protein PilV
LIYQALPQEIMARKLGGIRMPSQTKIDYFDTAGAAVSNDGYTALASGGSGSGHFNLVKDLSLLNRYGLEHTTRNGTPLVYRCRVTLHGMTYAGIGPTTAGFRGVQTDSDDTSTITSADGFTLLKIEGVQNTWVMKEASKRFHQAREKMFSEGGIAKSSRGKYSHTIRYNYDGASDTWGTPVNGGGTAFTGGTWDVSTVQYEGDNSFQLSLVGQGDDEGTNEFSGTVLSIGHAYLLSRTNMPSDTNEQTSETPANYSVLRRMLADQSQLDASHAANLQADARNQQDNPPYEVLDISDSGDVDHDVTKSVELGRVAVELGAISKSIVIDVPFGIMHCEAQHYSKDDDNESYTPFWSVEVLKISEMTG